MHAGISLTQLGNLIVKQNTEKRDFIVPTSRLELVAAGVERPALRFAPNGDVVTAELTELATNQILTWAGIPKKYADVLVNDERNRELLEQNVNHWFAQLDKNRMVRSFVNGKAVARAFLSDKYRTLDNYDLAHAIMPMLTSNGMEIKSCELTQSRLYIQAVDTKLVAKLKPGTHQRVLDDTVYGGVVISNSEVGHGSLSIEGLLYRLVCTNGLIVGKSFRKYHVGRSNSNSQGEIDAFEVFSDDTKAKTDIALWAQVKDVVTAALSESAFQAVVDKLNGSMRVELPRDPKHIVEVTAAQFGLSQSESDAVLLHLFESGDPTLFGLTNAVTRTAQDLQYDRAVELERMGSDVLMLDPKVFSKN